VNVMNHKRMQEAYLWNLILRLGIILKLFKPPMFFLTFLNLIHSYSTSYTFMSFLATTSIYQGKNMKKGWSRIIINFVKWWLHSKRWLWFKTTKNEYKGNQNESNPPLYMWNEFVHDNNGVTISKGCGM
jgi:hypothetical protein